MLKKYPWMKYCVVAISIICLHFIYVKGVIALYCPPGSIDGFGNCYCKISDTDNGGGGYGSGRCFLYDPNRNNSKLIYTSHNQRDCPAGQQCYTVVAVTPTPIIISNTPQPTTPPIQYTIPGTSLDQTIPPPGASLSCTTSKGTYGLCQNPYDYHHGLISSGEQTSDCTSGQICYIPDTKPTPIPQEACAGEINCQCKEYSPGSDKLDELIGQGTADSIKAVPILGGVLNGIDNSFAGAFAKLGLNSTNGLPSDYAGEENDVQMLAKYYAGCVENAICAETRDIGKIIGSDQTIVGENICIARSQWGQYLRDKKVIVASAKQLPVAQSQKNMLQKLLVAAETEDEKIGFLGSETAQKGIAGMCFKNIAYASNVTSVFTGLPIPEEIRQGNTTDLDVSSSDAIDQVVTGIYSGIVAIGKDIWTSYTVNTPGGMILRLFAWYRDPSFQSATAYYQSLMENGDAEILSQECQKEHSYRIKIIEDLGVGNDLVVVKVPPVCKTVPASNTMKDFMKALDDDRLYDIGIPRNKIAGVKSALGECLDCAQTGGLATAIGCVPVLNLQKFIAQTVFGIGMGFAGAFSVLCMIYGAILFQTSAGNSTQVEKAKKLIINCLIGLIVIVFSMFILKFIGIDLLRIPGIG